MKKQKIIYLLFMILSISFVTLSFKTGTNNKDGDVAKDSIASKKAFLQAYRVLMHPRCMNCHPIGDQPLQGDDSHIHTMNVKRGPDGKGLYAQKCSNCHQPQNTPGLHMPPGNPNWHLPPADMKMVFEGKTPRQLAAQLLNQNENGHKSIEQLIEHVTADKLVLGGWNPGDGRTLPPLTHAEFAKQFKLWIDKGAYLPDK
jgi:mono/diheme cytochrome c family protein